MDKLNVTDPIGIRFPLGEDGPEHGLVLSSRMFHKSPELMVTTILVSFLDPTTESGLGYVLHVAKSTDDGTQYARYALPRLDIANEVIAMIARAKHASEAP